MKNHHDPWVTTMSAERNPRLDTFWRRRLTMLVPTSRTSPVLSRCNMLWLASAGVLTLLLPTFLSLPALADQPKPAETKPAQTTSDDCPPSNETVAANRNHSDEKPALPDLRLTGVEVTGKAIASLAGRRWKTVTLAAARLDGTIIEPLHHAASIRTLRLSGTALSGQIGRLEHVRGLLALEIDAPLTGHDLEAIATLKQLERLSLPQELTINVSGAREIAKLINVKSLRLYGVNIDDASFVELHTLERLEELDLSHTIVTDKGLSTIENMRRLRTLDLDRSDMWKQQLTDACVPSIGCLPELERLSLSGKITNVGLVQVAKLPKLKSLSIFYTAITGDGLEALEHSMVETLTLSSRQIDSAALTHLKKCRTLKNVHVIGKYFVDMPDCQRALPKVSWSFSS